ncbi:MAG: class I mannose-6-phosphate isomerase [Oscillospiraceae bacterium]|nr:class I mannose-6-phosphate isomerase [Oscillospiraceae bacterium]MBQ8978998.1 class I mannose-6-phosphate isomerase [Oscillospiraceae bacterium]
MNAIKLRPSFKDYLWGGTRLRDDFGKDCDFDKVAESWELSCHKDGPSYVAEGEYEGMTLTEYAAKFPEVLGSACGRFEYFPILIKLIDAKDNLSVQVHPDNEYALRVEGEYGKTEMWYVIDADPGAQLLYGFKDSISKEEFRQRIENNTLLDVVNSVPVKKGDFFFIESGTLHAIGKGILIAEIQQNSNTTYRIYDYGRVGADGKPRQLHIDKAVEVTKLCPPNVHPKGEAVSHEDGSWVQTQLARCEYFTVNVLDIANRAKLEATERSFVHILVLEGDLVFSSGSQKDMKLKKGDSLFVPAGYGSFELTGKAQAVMTNID